MRDCQELQIFRMFFAPVRLLASPGRSPYSTQSSERSPHPLFIPIKVIMVLPASIIEFRIHRLSISWSNTISILQNFRELLEFHISDLSRISSPHSHFPLMHRFGRPLPSEGYGTP